MGVNVDLIPEDQHNPLVYWGCNENKFPEVADVAEGYLAVPPAQSDTEGLFSLLGLYQGLRGAQMSLDTMSDRLYIHRNFPDDMRTDLEHLLSLNDFQQGGANMTNEEIFESWKEAVSNTTDEILHMLEADGLTNANSHLFPDCELRELLVDSDLDEDNDEDCAAMCREHNENPEASRIY